MKRTLMLCLIVAVLAVPVLGGCNTVMIRGDALVALENSAIQAEVASALADSQAAPPEAADWANVQRYLAANARQWRAFMSSAKRFQWQAPTVPTTQPDSD